MFKIHIFFNFNKIISFSPSMFVFSLFKKKTKKQQLYCGNTIQTQRPVCQQSNSTTNMFVCHRCEVDSSFRTNEDKQQTTTTRHFSPQTLQFCCLLFHPPAPLSTTLLLLAVLLTQTHRNDCLLLRTANVKRMQIFGANKYECSHASNTWLTFAPVNH